MSKRKYRKLSREEQQFVVETLLGDTMRLADLAVLLDAHMTTIHYIARRYGLQYVHDSRRGHWIQVDPKTPLVRGVM